MSTDYRVFFGDRPYLVESIEWDGPRPFTSGGPMWQGRFAIRRLTGKYQDIIDFHVRFGGIVTLPHEGLVIAEPARGTQARLLKAALTEIGPAVESGDMAVLEYAKGVYLDQLDEPYVPALVMASAPEFMVFGGKRRDPKWGGVRATHLEIQPHCAACGTLKDLEVHHIIPYHECPEKELDPENLLTLCNYHGCHLVIGHLCSYYSYNPDVVKDAARWLKRVRERP